MTKTLSETKTQLDEARENLDESMSVLAMAAASLSNVCDSFLQGESDERGRVSVGHDEKNTIMFLASHLRDLVQAHISRWDHLEELMKGQSHGHD